MPIDKDGNITAGIEYGSTRYVTRVTLAFEYSALLVDNARAVHLSIIQSLTEGAGQLSEAIGPDVDVNVGYAKNPAALPEGEGEDGVQS